MGGGGERTPVAEINSEFIQESLVCDFTCPSPENLNTLYIKVVGILPFPKITIPERIDFCNYIENYAEYKDNWEVDYDGVVGPFFSDIADKKDIDDDRYNPVSMRG